MDNNCKLNYFKSYRALIEYIKISDKNPTEKQWNSFASQEGYLSSQSLGYISALGFNKLCKSIRKGLKKGDDIFI